MNYWGEERMEVPEYDELDAEYDPEFEGDEAPEDIAEAKRHIERALFVNGGLRNFLTVRRQNNHSSVQRAVTGED